MANHGRSAVSISTIANGALGELCRHYTDGIKLEIAPQGCRSSMRGSTDWPHAHASREDSRGDVKDDD